MRLFGLLCLLLLGSANSAPAQDDPLQQAREAYQRLDFEEALERFSSLAEDPGLDRKLRMEAFQYLGRVYVARNHYEQARQAIERMLDLEPPVRELDPDVEPPPLVRLYYDARRERTDSYGPPPDSSQITMAVVDFTNGSPSPYDEQFDAWRIGLAAMMINYLNGATELRVVERERLQWLLSELDLQRDQRYVDQAAAVRAGKLLGAHYVLIGNFMVVQERLFLGARLVRVETGEVLEGTQRTGKLKAFDEVLQQLSTEIAVFLDRPLPEETLGARTPTNSLEAMMAYSHGLQLLEQGDFQAAYGMFQDALDYDPNYQKARQRIESIRPLL